MSKLMIMSLCGSPEPLKKSIDAHQPERIVFLASQDSVLKAGEIINALEASTTEEPDAKNCTSGSVREVPGNRHSYRGVR